MIIFNYQIKILIGFSVGEIRTGLFVSVYLVSQIPI